MPLPERVIEPVAVCRGTLQLPVPDELEGVTNGSLANITRQLSTLSRHAEEMFGNLFMEAESLAVRGSNLQARIDKLAVKVTQLDSNVEEVTLQEIQLRKAFRSTQAFDQQVVSRDTMPKSMLEQYLSCDKPPPLDKLNPYREDGKDGLKFYTDANYFFDLWKSEMLQSTERAEKGRRGGLKSSRMDGNRHRKKVRQPPNTTERQRQKVLQDGEYIMEDRIYTDGRMYAEGRMEGGSRGLSVSFNLPESNGYKIVPGGYDPSEMERSAPRPNSIDLQGQPVPNQGYYAGGYERGPQRVVRFETSRNTEESIYTPRILREPDQRSVQFDLPPKAYGQEAPPVPESPTDSSRSGTPQRRPANPPPAPPPQLATPTRGGRAGSTGRDSLPPPPPPPASELSNMTLNGPLPIAVSPAGVGGGSEPDLPPPPPVPDTLAPRSVPAGHMAPSPPPPPAPCTEPSPSQAPPPPAPPPPPPPPPAENGIKLNGDVKRPQNPCMESVLKSIASGETQLKKVVRKPEDDVRSDLLKAIRDGISLKKVEQKADQTQTAGLSDVASILARRVALEVSDSDDGPSDSEYDSDDWGETDA